jgi:hypothetical protein
MHIIKIEEHIQSTGEVVYGAWRYDEKGQRVCQVAYDKTKEGLIDFLKNGGNFYSQDAVLENL